MPYTDPHGSTGRDEAWLRAIRSPEAAVTPGTGWGRIDADDVLAVLDATLERDPALDPDRSGFPEEGHGLSRGGLPRHRVQRAEIILDWFGRHLRGGRPEVTWDHPPRRS